MEAISDLPMLHDIDADYSPQYVKLARILRDKIEAGEYKRMDAVPAAGLVNAYGVSKRVAYAALEMLAANRYVGQLPGLKSYRVIWEAPARSLECRRMSARVEDGSRPC
jgi:DNA-binding transcriptional MocR family regulator